MISQLSPPRPGALVSFGRSEKNSRACPASWKRHFYRHGIRTQKLPLPSFRLSNSAKLFSQLDKCHSSWYIYTKTWKGQLQAVTMALWPMATSSVRSNSHLKWFHVQDTESYVIGCEFLKFYNLWSLCDCPMHQIHCVKADFTRYCGTAYKVCALPCALPGKSKLDSNAVSSCWENWK